MEAHAGAHAALQLHHAVHALSIQLRDHKNAVFPRLLVVTGERSPPLVPEERHGGRGSPQLSEAQ
jgi:hypothetical protein